MRTLLAEGGESFVDYLKVGPFMGRETVAELAPQYPLLLHLGDTLSGYAPLPDPSVQLVLDWVQLTGTPWTSEHIGFSLPNVDVDGALGALSGIRPLSRDQAMTNIVRNARALAQRLPVPLILENIPVFPGPAHVHVAEPDFVAEVIRETNCDLLLDLAHARVAADVLGYEVHRYLESLPLERAVELHISGPRPYSGIRPRLKDLIRTKISTSVEPVAFDADNLIDAHEPLQDDDYSLLEWVLGRTTVKAVSLEYYWEPAPLRDQLKRLGAILGRHSW